MAEATMYFPADFLWGTATSAHQVEGNNRNNDWWQWEQQEGTILNGASSGLACNWWEDAEADLDRAAELGTNAHRLSLEWSRIEPEPSVFDREALDRYREILAAMRARHLAPMVTLHHFSNPQWLAEKGDFGSDLVVDYFQRYVARVAEHLGDLVAQWITINEPMVYVVMRHVEKVFPAQGRRGWGVAASNLHNLLRCHAAAYHTLKAAYPGTPVGVAKNMIAFDPRPGGNPVDAWWANQISYFFNDWWMEAMQDGRLRRPLGRGQIKGLKGSFDFTGINYYTRFYVRFPGMYERTWKANALISDGDYGEVYPEGLFRVIKHALRYGKPIYITENGLPDARDRLRATFLLGHLREVWRAVSFCWPIMGYYHWTLVDNFEWDRGWTQRFGLYSLEPTTQQRRMRNSGHLYREICKQGAISSDMAQRYAPDLLPSMFPG